jgi:hypothetical protein
MSPVRGQAIGVMFQSKRALFGSLQAIPAPLRGRRGAIPERVLNLFVGFGLLGILLYGVISWKSSGDDFPADMRRSTIEIRSRGFLLAGLLGGSRETDELGTVAVERLASDLRVQIHWVDEPASDLLRRLEADSLDVLVGYDASLSGAKAFGLTAPYLEVGESRFVLAVSAGENRLLRLAHLAVRSVRASDQETSAVGKAPRVGPGGQSP